MRWKSENQIERVNSGLSNKYCSKGTIAELGAGRLISEEGFIQDFIISGINDRQILEPIIGMDIPIIILCGGSAIYRNVFEGTAEPFLGMTDFQAVTTIKKLALRQGYSAMPLLDNVIMAHCRILHILGVPLSLSGFHYLCGFGNIGEFRDCIMELNTSQSDINSIWADINNTEELSIFRSTVFKLCEESVQIGWDPDNEIENVNCLTAINADGQLFLRIDNNADTLIAYLVEELKAARDRQFLLILDDIILESGSLSDFLQKSSNFRIGIISDNAADLFGDNEKLFNALVGRAGSIILFKHRSGKSAEAFSEVIGKFDSLKYNRSTGYTQGFFDLLPRGYHSNTNVSKENVYRIKPEEITALDYNEAIVFDTDNNNIIYYTIT